MSPDTFRYSSWWLRPIRFLFFLGQNPHYALDTRREPWIHTSPSPDERKTQVSLVWCRLRLDYRQTLSTRHGTERARKLLVSSASLYQHYLWSYSFIWDSSFSEKLGRKTVRSLCLMSLNASSEGLTVRHRCHYLSRSMLRQRLRSHSEKYSSLYLCPIDLSHSFQSIGTCA